MLLLWKFPKTHFLLSELVKKSLLEWVEYVAILWSQFQHMVVYEITSQCVLVFKTFLIDQKSK